VGNNAKLKRIDRRTEAILAQIAETNADIKAMLRESKAGRADARAEARAYAERARADAERARADAERHTQAIEDQRLAINQWNMRQEKMMQEVLAATQEMIANIREWRYEGVEEARAQRAALWAILDELKGGGPATA
jgi:hypothetical protein